MATCEAAETEYIAVGSTDAECGKGQEFGELDFGGWWKVGKYYENQPQRDLCHLHVEGAYKLLVLLVFIFVNTSSLSGFAC